MSALTLGPVCLGFSLWKMHPASWREPSQATMEMLHWPKYLVSGPVFSRAPPSEFLEFLANRSVSQGGWVS